MLFRDLIGATELAATLSMTVASAQDVTKYPDWSGQWTRKQGDPAGSYDPTKPSRPASRAMRRAARATTRPIYAFPAACRGS
jgi:hypothetical protein